MIKIYYSNKLECLKTKLFEIISCCKSNNIFYSEVILVENIATKEWLYIELAKYFGISANIIFYSPFNFIWNIVHKSLWGIFPKRSVSYTMIFWMFMKILSNIEFDTDLIPNWSILQKYLYNDVDKKKYLKFSEKITNLFIQYFIYHPDWLSQWKFGKKVKGLDIYIQSWQSELWCLFLEEVNRNENFFCCFKHDIYEYIINVLKNNDIKLIQLPKRIFVYGISSFSTILLDILKALGKYINIYIFCINPSYSFFKKNLYCNDTVNMMEMKPILSNNYLKSRLCNFFDHKVSLFDRNRTCFNINNSLLSSWAKKFQKTFNILSQLNIIREQNIFSKNIQNTFLLHILQNDILSNHSQTKDSIINISNISKDNLNIKKRLLYSGDSSLSIHVCYSIQREVEILFDNLLTMMSNDSLLLPHEIIVMAPNINDYISSIQSVFNYSSSRDRHLPFTIFDAELNNENSIISSVFRLLKISYSRFTVEEVLEFLSVPSLAMRFSIDEEGVKLLGTWILESGICWGLDDDAFSDYIMSSVTDVQCTWKFGLDRIFLGYTMNSTSGSWNKTLPYNISNNRSNSLYTLIGQFNYFLMKLKYWKDRLSKFYILKEWLPLLEDIINDFYINNFNYKTESSLLLLKNYWREIITAGISVNYSQSIPVSALVSKLYDKFKKKVKNRFFTGGIVFCNLSSAHAIPFKVVYLLGMGANFYPSDNISLNFNLMKNEGCIGYLNTSLLDDRYLFLEALLSAREQFFISFVGHSMHNDKKYHPSVLITELCEYIVHHFFYIEKHTKNILPLTINWVYTNFWNWHTSMPFEEKNFISGSKNQSFFKEWLLLSNDITNKPHSKFFYPLSKSSIKIIFLDNLYNFYIHPIRYWFQNRLKIYIPERSEFSSDEPFFLDFRTQYRICKDLIFAFLNGKDIDVLYQHFRGSGILPYGSFGDIAWMKLYDSMMRLSKLISQYYFPMDRYDLNVSLLFDSHKLTGVLTSIQKNGLLRWKPTLLSMKDGLLLWLEHLVYCAMGGEGDSWIFGMNSSWHFHSLSQNEAKEYLLFLMFGYCNGMSVPLLLFNHSGGVWLRNCFDFKKRSISLDLNRQNKARHKLIMAWRGNQYTYGEISDPYIKRLIPNLCDKDIDIIIEVTKDYFLPLMQFNIDINLNNKK